MKNLEKIVGGFVIVSEAVGYTVLTKVVSDVAIHEYKSWKEKLTHKVNEESEEQATA